MMRIPFNLGQAVAEVDSLPGCSQVAVFHASNVHPDYRNFGVGMKAHVERLGLMYVDFLYDAAVATVDENNHPQVRIMEKTGWQRALVFTSRRTGHDVAIWVKILGEI